MSITSHTWLVKPSPARLFNGIVVQYSFHHAGMVKSRLYPSLREKSRTSKGVPLDCKLCHEKSLRYSSLKHPCVWVDETQLCFAALYLPDLAAPVLGTWNHYLGMGLSQCWSVSLAMAIAPRFNRGITKVRIFWTDSANFLRGLLVLVHR